jgi:hypothetical protein
VARCAAPPRNAAPQCGIHPPRLRGFPKINNPCECGLRTPLFVIPTKVGIQCGCFVNHWCDWIPAFAGMTLCSSFMVRMVCLFSASTQLLEIPLRGGRGDTVKNPLPRHFRLWRDGVVIPPLFFRVFRVFCGFSSHPDR